MAQQNINQYVYKKFYLSPYLLDLTDISLASDEVDYNQEVVFSPYLIAQTHGNRLPFYFDLSVGVLLAWCGTSLFSSHFSTFTEGRFIYLWLGVLLAYKK